LVPLGQAPLLACVRAQRDQRPAHEDEPRQPEQVYERLLQRLHAGGARRAPPTRRSPASQSRFTSGFCSAFRSTLPSALTWSAIRNRSPPVRRSWRIETSLETWSSAKYWFLPGR